MKNVIITGGAGFIGSHLCERLTRLPVASIKVYDNFSSGNSAHREILHDLGVQLIEKDLQDLDSLTQSMDGCDTLFHLAANPDIAKAVTQPDIDFWQGTYLAQNAFEAARRNGVKRVFYTSGSGVYGENASVSFAESFGPMRPISTYGASKLACESLLCSYCHMFNMEGRAFRFANVVGPRQTHGVGYDFVRRLRADPTRLRVLGDGTQSKSYIHVDDVLDAIFLVGGRAAGAYDIYNVATGDYITVREIAEIAVQICGIRSPVNFEYSGGDRGWKGDVPVVRFDCSKIRALGWTCKRGSADAIRASMTAMHQSLS